MAQSNIAGKYASVNGLNLYYEIHGTGEPLILLHGGIGASEMFGPNLTRLARGRQVIAVHLQGHGRTLDIERPLRYETMADDIAALIDHLGFEHADVMGYSLGGGVALQTAIRHPKNVSKLVVISVPMRHDGWYPEVLLNFDRMASQAAQLSVGLRQSPLAKSYPDVDWEGLFTKVGQLESRNYDWSLDVAVLAIPTMIMFADADSVRLEHILDFYRLLGGGIRDAGLDGSGRPATRLAIVPGTTHYDVLSTEVVADLVAPFLDVI